MFQLFTSTNQNQQPTCFNLCFFPVAFSLNEQEIAKKANKIIYLLLNRGINITRS